MLAILKVALKARKAVVICDRTCQLLMVARGYLSKDVYYLLTLY